MALSSIITQRISEALEELHVPDCDDCQISFRASANVLEWHEREATEIEAGGVTWELDPHLDEDLVAVKMVTCLAHADGSSVRHHIAPPWIAAHQVTSYVRLRKMDFTIEQATTFLHFRSAKTWIDSEDAVISCSLLVELRREAQLDPAIPEEWMGQLEWLAKHAPQLGPKAAAAVVFGSRTDLPRAE